MWISPFWWSALLWCRFTLLAQGWAMLTGIMCKKGYKLVIHYSKWGCFESDLCCQVTVSLPHFEGLFFPSLPWWHVAHGENVFFLIILEIAQIGDGKHANFKKNFPYLAKKFLRSHEVVFQVVWKGHFLQTWKYFKCIYRSHDVQRIHMTGCIMYDWRRRLKYF